MENKSICCKFKYQDWSTLSTVSVGWDINMLGDLDYHLGDLDYSLLIQLIVASGHAQLFDLQVAVCVMFHDSNLMDSVTEIDLFHDNNLSCFQVLTPKIKH